jgi:hypothetical protein
MEFSPSNIPSAQDLLRSGGPFVPFSEFPVQTIHETPGWFERKIQEGKPFVIRGLNQIGEWDASALSNECLVASSSSGGTSGSCMIETRNKVVLTAVFDCALPSNTRTELSDWARYPDATS